MTNEALTLYDVLQQYERDNQERRPAGNIDGRVRLTASALHGICPRQTAFQALGEEPTHPERLHVPAANTVGTMLHEVYASFWKRQPRTIVETPTAYGTPDVVLLDDGGEVTQVRDLKTVGTRKMRGWIRADGPPDHVWDQLAIYGYASGATEDSTLVIDALARETGEAATFTTPYDPAWGARVAEALEAKAQDMTARPGLQQPTNGRTGDDAFCRRCPFQGYCLAEMERSRSGLTVIDGGRQ